MKDIKAKILSNEQISNNYYRMAISASYIAKVAKPGQFVQVRCCETYEPFLRRPFSIHRLSVIGNRLSVLELLYEVVGQGTETLAKRKEGELIDVLGPLGNGFTLPPITDHRSPITVLIAGGIGVAPLLFLAEKLTSIKHQASSIKIIVLIGAKTKEQILCEKDFRKLGCEVHIATDDGTYGYKGFVSDLLEDYLGKLRRLPKATYEVGEVCVYACGPEPMLKSVAGICKDRKLKCQVCLEELMVCGIGACLGCVKKTKSGNRLVCKDGPVFNADEPYSTS